jgi:hypothetical protein
MSGRQQHRRFIQAAAPGTDIDPAGLNVRM